LSTFDTSITVQLPFTELDSYGTDLGYCSSAFVLYKMSVEVVGSSMSLLWLPELCRRTVLFTAHDTVDIEVAIWRK